MKYRLLGSTNLSVSEIGFGTIPILQGNIPVLPEYYNLTQDEALHLLNYAFLLGCNLFDTAIVPEYGDAEIKLGKFAAMIDRNRFIISDKARCFTGNEMYQAVLTSCENLGCTPDLYFVHQVDETSEDTVFSQYGALDALTELKKEGKLRFVGIASHYYDILLRAAFDVRVDVLQGSGNLLERGMLERIQLEPAFRQKGILVNKVYAAGILPSFFSEDILISSVLSYPISCALIGFGTKEQFDLAVHAEEISGVKLPSFEQVIGKLEKYFHPIPCDRCQRCHCPFGTEIHTLFRQYNYYHLGKNYWALRKLDLGIRESANYCRNCISMTCMKQCPRNLRIPDYIQQIESLVAIHVHNSRI